MPQAPICVAAYVKRMRQEHLFHTPAADPITPVTFIGVGVIFFIIVVNNSRGGRVALTSAAVGALAAPMIFEFPFDLIVMTRTYPPIPPDPALYRVLFFAPLFLVEFTTLALLTLSPMVRLSRTTFFLFALMLGVFAVWGLSGCAYPSAPLPTALNVVSKLLAFAVALSLFFPQRAQASAPGPASRSGYGPFPVRTRPGSARRTTAVRRAASAGPAGHSSRAAAPRWLVPTAGREGMPAAAAPEAGTAGE